MSEEYVAPDVGEPGPTVVETPVPEAKPDPIAPLGEVLKQLNDQMRSNSASINDAKLLGDPQIRAYLDAKAKGKTVRFAEEAPAASKPQEMPQPPVALEEMTNAQLMEYNSKLLDAKLANFLQTISSGVEAKISAVKSELEPQVAGVMELEEQRVKASVAAQIKQAAADYPDFEQMKPLIAKVNQDFAGAVNPPNLKELYLLAKIRSGQSLVSQAQMSSEKPGVPPSRRAPFKRPQNTTGRQGFTDLVGAALKESNPYNQE